MPLICLDCPNKTRFLEDEQGGYSRTNIIDQDRSNEDILEDDIWVDEQSNLRCTNCDSHNIEEVNDETWEIWTGPKIVIDWKARYSKKR